MTDAGTAAALNELLSGITAPFVGAAPVNVTVPVAGAPPVIVAGVTVTLDSAAGVTDNDAVFVPPHAPEITVEADAATASVVTENCADIALAGTVTMAGTVAAAVFDELSATGTPPAGAFPINVTVPVTVTPPGTLVALSVRFLSDDAMIASVPVALVA